MTKKTINRQLLRKNKMLNRLKTKLSLFMIVILSILFGMPGADFANAADLYVTPDTSVPNGDGSEQSPYNSIDTALNAAQPGDTVRLLPGVYYTPVNFPHGGTDDNPITLTSHDSPLTAVIDCQNSGNVNGVNVTYSNIVVDGLEVRNVYYSGIKVDGDVHGTTGADSYGNWGGYHSRLWRLHGADNIIIKNNKIHEIGYDGIKVGHVDNIQILNNEIYNCGADPNTTQQGIDLVGVYSAIIRGNYVHDEELSQMSVGIFFKGGSEDIICENNYVADILSPFAGIEIGGDTEWYSTRYTPSNFDYDINSAIMQSDQSYDNNLINNQETYQAEFMAEARNVIVRGNIVVRSNPPLSFRNVYNAQVYNNTIIDSGWSQGWVKLWSDGNHNHPCLNIRLDNNLFLNNSVELRDGGAFNDKYAGTIYPLNTIGMTASNNLFWSNGAAPALGNSAVDPDLQLFADPQLDENYQISSVSPAFNAGIDLFAAGVLSSVYNNRFKVSVPQNQFDIGAYEVPVEGGDGGNADSNGSDDPVQDGDMTGNSDDDTNSCFVMSVLSY